MLMKRSLKIAIESTAWKRKILAQVLHTKHNAQHISFNIFPQIDIHFNHTIVCLVFSFVSSIYVRAKEINLGGFHTFWLNQHKLNLFMHFIFVCGVLRTGVFFHFPHIR